MKQYASRLKRTSTTDDAGGYDVLGHLRDAGTFVATGQMPVRASASATNPLDDELKRQRLLTGDPDFQIKLAQTKAQADLESQIAADEAKVNAKRERQRALFGGEVQPQMGGSPFGQAKTTPALFNGESLGSVGKDDKSPFLMLNKPKGDPETGVMIPEYAYEKNPEYLDPKAREEMKAAEQQKQLRDEMVRSEGLSQLQALRGAKKGLGFFGPMGGELPSTVMGFPNPAVGTSYPGNSKISDRTDWEANLENLSANKMLDTMMKMKEASKTGATGFGQLSEKEGQVLRDASMKLRRNLSPEQAKVYIDQMEVIQMKALGMPLSPEQQIILDQINSGTYPVQSNTTIVGATSGGMKSYASPAEADANEAPGTIVMVQGRRYQV